MAREKLISDDYDGLCCIKGCSKPIKAAWLCNTHYHNLLKYGHPLAEAGSRYDTESKRVYRPQMRERWAWRGMIDRCYNERSANYVHYGARGIAVCERWRRSFDDFYADLGPKLNGHSLERIDPNGNYEPSNCRWATATEQNRNKRGVRLTASIVSYAKTVVGLGCSIASVARDLGVPYPAIYQAVNGASWKEVHALV